MAMDSEVLARIKPVQAWCVVPAISHECVIISLSPTQSTQLDEIVRCQHRGGAVLRLDRDVRPLITKPSVCVIRPPIALRWDGLDFEMEPMSSSVDIGGQASSDGRWSRACGAISSAWGPIRTWPRGGSRVTIDCLRLERRR